MEEEKEKNDEESEKQEEKDLKEDIESMMELTEEAWERILKRCSHVASFIRSVEFLSSVEHVLERKKKDEKE